MGGVGVEAPAQPAGGEEEEEQVRVGRAAGLGVHAPLVPTRGGGWCSGKEVSGRGPGDGGG